MSVVTPSSISALYSLRPSTRYSIIRVACPKQMGTTPVATGSSVPPWPTFFWRLARFNRRTTSMDVSP